MVPKEVQMTGDAKDYKFLTPAEKECMTWFYLNLFLWIRYKQIT